MRRGAAWPYLLPTLMVLAATAGWPLARTLWLGMTDALLGAADEPRFVGFANHLALLGDPEWWRVVGTTLVFAAASVSLELVLGVAIALALDVRFPGRWLLRAAVLVPWAIPTVVSAKMWAWMLHDLHGVVNAALLALGLVAEPVAWTADPHLALVSVIAVDVWKTTPFVAILTLAGLQLVPRELYEAATLDGAGRATSFLFVTLPIIWPVLAVAVTFRLLDALRIFDVVYVLTGTSAATMTMSVYVRQQLVEFQDVGYGSAAATFVLLAVAAAIALFVVARRLAAGRVA